MEKIIKQSLEKYKKEPLHLDIKYGKASHLKQKN